MIITRRFILAATAFGASFSLGGALSLASVECFGCTTILLRSLIPAPMSSRKIGRIYLAGHQEEEGTGALTRLILSSMSLDEGYLVAVDRQALLARVTSRVRADFAQGDTVEIGGWILARTEARLCALWTYTTSSEL
jgi:hypothetical protein